ncbi:MAG: hypothetical protein IJ875_02405 [Solobacterium sp.]|nr:hypothetical protein [Solobacterium sp.]
MKLILIEQDKVVFQTEQKCDKYNFPTLFNEYRMAHIQNPTIENKTNAAYRFYISSDTASLETLYKLFGKQNYIEIDCLKEADLSALDGKSFHDIYQKAKKKWKRNIPLNDKQEVRLFLNELEKNDEDSVLITTETKIHLLISLLKEMGYLIEKPRLFGSKPLDRIRATKKHMHCGNCQHNCLLTKPKCDIGRDKARMRGIKFE